jgi:hypothetical protein
MSHQLTRRDFALRTAGFDLALGLAPAATRAEAEQAAVPAYFLAGRAIGVTPTCSSAVYGAP